MNGKEVANYTDHQSIIPVGGMEMAVANGLNGKNWIAKNGKYTITSTIEIAVDKDLNSKNNTCQAEIVLPQRKVIPMETAKILSHTAKIDLKLPSKSGEYTLVARIVYNGEVVESVRDINVQ